MADHFEYKPQSRYMQWLERRLPIGSLVYPSFIAYPTPRNLNYWWTFGGFLTFMLGGTDHYWGRAGDAIHAEC